MSTVLLFALMLTATSMTSFGQATTPDKYPRTVTDLRLTAQTETISMTTFFTPKTDGIYQFLHYVVVTLPACCSDSLGANRLWTDESGVNTEANVPPVRCIGGSSQSTIVARGVAGKHQVLNSDLPSGEEYGLFLVVERLTNK
jgi:hypothetical protein